MAESENGADKAPGDRVVIKKYANRRLYNTATSTYVTLDNLATMVREGVDFVVYDAKTNEDITRSVLAQIIFEEESKGESLLPIQFLRQLIGFYGDSMQAVLPSYLEMSLDSFTRQQEQFRSQMAQTFGAAPGANLFDEQVRGSVHGYVLLAFQRRHAAVWQHLRQASDPLGQLLRAVAAIQ